MKNFTRLTLCAASLGAFCLAGAQANWAPNMDFNDLFLKTQKSGAIVGDFSNNGHLDIISMGNSWQSYYDHPGIWSWQLQSNLYLNQGNGQWTRDIIDVEPTGEFTDDDEPREYYRYVKNKSGIAPMTHAHFATLDYNNDGLLDLIALGFNNSDDFMSYQKGEDEWTQYRYDYPFHDLGGRYQAVLLYKNLGDARFEVVREFQLPAIIPDNNNGESLYHHMFAVGDYDHDGYTDIAISGLYPQHEEGEPGRCAALFHNDGGTGSFTQMNIAETIGGAWSNGVKDEEGEYIIPRKEYPGYFMFISGNVYMADLNNDGWLDLIFDGWTDQADDGVHENGSNARVYLNQEGKKFVDITPMSAEFYATRSGSGAIVDIDGDGYLDFVNAGYGDHGIGWATLLFLNTADENVFDAGENMTYAGLPQTESHRLWARDFDGDGNIDFFYDGASDSFIYYGQADMTYVQAPQLPARGFNGNDANTGVGDVTGNGLADRFQTGYVWCADDYRELLFGDTNDWHWDGTLWENQTEVEIVAPEAPTDVRAEVVEGNVVVTWADNDDIYSAYNVVVYNGTNVIANLPVNPTTSALLVSENKEQCVRPGIQQYTVPALDGELKVGVQAVSLANEKASEIVYVAPTAISTVSSDSSNAAPVYYNLQGIRVQNPQNGIFVKICGNKAVKVVM